MSTGQVAGALGGIMPVATAAPSPAAPRRPVVLMAWARRGEITSRCSGSQRPLRDARAGLVLLARATSPVVGRDLEPSRRRDRWGSTFFRCTGSQISGCRQLPLKVQVSHGA